MIRTAFFSLALLILVVGCASTVISDERIRSSTAGMLGIEPDEVTIQNRRSEVTNTYYIAKTKAGDEYACTISGSLLSAGLTNPPECKKK